MTIADSGGRDHARHPDPFIEHISRLKGQRVHFYPGSCDIDGVISTLAAYDVFRRLDIACLPHRTGEPVSDADIVIGAGRHGSDRASGCVFSDFENLLRRNQAVFLPQNILRYDQAQLLADASTTVFCSSALSLQIALLQGADPERTHFAHDLAAYIDPGDLEQHSAPSTGTLVIGDADYCGAQNSGLDHVALSGCYGSDRLTSYEYCRTIVDALILTLRPYEQVSTNRPGLALLAASLKKSVRFQHDRTRSQGSALDASTVALFSNLTTSSPHLPAEDRLASTPGGEGRDPETPAQTPTFAGHPASDTATDALARSSAEVSDLGLRLVEAQRRTGLAAQAYEAELSRVTAQSRDITARAVQAALNAEGRWTGIPGQETKQARLVPYTAFKAACDALDILESVTTARLARLNGSAARQAETLRAMHTDLQHARRGEAAARRVAREVRDLVEARHAELEQQASELESAAVSARADVDGFSAEAGLMLQKESSFQDTLNRKQADLHAKLASRITELESDRAAGPRNPVAAVRRWRRKAHDYDAAMADLAEAEREIEQTRHLTVDATQERQRLQALAIEAEPRASELASAAAVLRDQSAEAREILAQLPILAEPQSASSTDDYDRWTVLYDTIDESDRRAIKARILRLTYQPLISIVVLTSGLRAKPLSELVLSLQRQLYTNWELCVADHPPHDPSPQVEREGAAADPRIKVVPTTASDRSTADDNPALASAHGDFIALLRHDSILAEQALFEVVVALGADRATDILYADEDHIDGSGRRSDPYFKPDYNRELMLGQNLFGSFGVYRRDLVQQVGGLRAEYAGSQEYDLALRVIEATTPDRIKHIPAVLTHRSPRTRDTAPTARDRERSGFAARRALSDHLARTHQPGSVMPHPSRPTWHRLQRQRPDPPPMVSIIVPTKDQPAVLRACIEGLLNRTAYPNVEIIIVDHQSVDVEAVRLLTRYAENPRVRLFPFTGVFNYSAMNNAAVQSARGSLLALLNNDVDVIDPQWLDEMVSLAALPDVGAVGAKLLYADGRVQHAGVLLGPGGVAGHMFHLLEMSDPGYFGRAVLASDVSAVTAACLVVRKSVFLEVGGFDSVNLPVAFNDVDLCLKLRQSGYRNVWTPSARLYHHESLSRGSDQAPHRVAQFNAEIAFMIDKWGSVLTTDPFYNPNLNIGDG